MDAKEFADEQKDEAGKPQEIELTAEEKKLPEEAQRLRKSGTIKMVGPYNQSLRQTMHQRRLPQGVTENMTA